MDTDYRVLCVYVYAQTAGRSILDPIDRRKLHVRVQSRSVRSSSCADLGAFFYRTTLNLNQSNVENKLLGPVSSLVTLFA